jgi:hypothetical protein
MFPDLNARFWVFAAFVGLVFLMGGGSRDDIASLVILRPACAFFAAYALTVAGPGDLARVRVPLLLLLALVVLVIASAARGGPLPALSPPHQDLGARYETAKDVPVGAGLRFDPSMAPSDQQIVRQVIAEARPEARRLVGLVSGLVTISVGQPGRGIAGQTRPTADGYDVVLDLGGVYRSSGLRGVRRLVLHELAHVVDLALVPGRLESQLDDATPRGFGCDGGRSGACAVRSERFAESFAKWATGDIGNDVHLGYSVPPPKSLSGWGGPLAAIRR